MNAQLVLDFRGVVFAHEHVVEIAAFFVLDGSVVVHDGVVIVVVRAEARLGKRRGVDFRVGNRVFVSRVLVVSRHGVGQSEHRERHHAQKYREDKAEGFDLEAACADAQRIAEGQVRADELAVLRRVVFQLHVIGVGVGESVLAAVVVDFQHLFNLDVFLFVGADNRVAVGFGDISVNEIEVARSEAVAFLYVQHLVVHRAHALGKFRGVRRRLGHVGDDNAVLKLDDAVGVELGKVAVVPACRATAF